MIVLWVTFVLMPFSCSFDFVFLYLVKGWAEFSDANLPRILQRCALERLGSVDLISVGDIKVKMNCCLIEVFN